MILTVTLNPALQRYYTLDGFTLQGKHRAQTVALHPTGAGVDISRVLSQLGVPTLATGILGGQTGRLIRAELNKWGVPSDFVQIRGESRGGTVLIDEKKGIEAQIVEPGPSVPAGVWPRLEKKLAQLAPQSSWVVLAGGPPPGTPLTVFHRLLKTVQKTGVKTALDTASPWLGEGLRAQPDLVQATWEEFQGLVGPCYSTFQALQKGKGILKGGSTALIIVLEEKGALALHQEEAFLGLILKTGQTISPVGLEGSLLGGFLAQRKQEKDFEQSLRFGLTLAASHARSGAEASLDPWKVAPGEERISLEKIPLPR